MNHLSATATLIAVWIGAVCVAGVCRAQDSTLFLSDAAISESSGLAESNLSPGHFWTHNDSGDSARMFSFSSDGKVTGGCELVGVRAVDFEDAASFIQDGVPRMVFADVGDNDSARRFISLYFFDEPDPKQNTSITNWTRIDLRYPDGARDCEAIMVDSDSATVTLVTKSFLPTAAIYITDLPPRRPNASQSAAATTDGSLPKTAPPGPNAATQSPEPRTLKLVGKINLPLVTAMTRDPSSGDILVVNYFQMYRFPKPQPDQPWWTQTPTATDLPRLKQIEAVVADRQGTVWVTSEGTPAPWAKVLENRE
jgi:hypothetical protein